MADVDHEPGGQGLNRKSSTFFEADKVRQRDGLVFIKERVFSVGLQADAGHTHSRLKRFHLRSYLIDYTRGLHAGRIGQFGPDEVGALAKEVIREIYPDGMIPHPHHSGAQFRFWNVNNLHNSGTANFVELNCLHALVTSGFRYTSQSLAGPELYGFLNRCGRSTRLNRLQRAPRCICRLVANQEWQNRFEQCNQLGVTEGQLRDWL